MTGKVHSFETLGTLDGPGVRVVVFLAGCPLRCLYCHNPDTWVLSAGQPQTVAQIVERARRLRPYFGTTGGVTLSGGEPLAQPHFTLAVLRALRAEGIHTALDTSGAALFTQAERMSGRDRQVLAEILRQTDLLLLDIKAAAPDAFRALTGGSQAGLIQLLELAEAGGQKTWIRQVVVPGLNASPTAVRDLLDLLAQYPRLKPERIEFLPYHTLGVAKYEKLGLPCPLAGTPALSAGELADLQRELMRQMRQAAGREAAQTRPQPGSRQAVQAVIDQERPEADLQEAQERQRLPGDSMQDQI
jgi:pyruvate formate lyase activating enzyme